MISRGPESKDVDIQWHLDEGHTNDFWIPTATIGKFSYTLSMRLTKKLTMEDLNCIGELTQAAVYESITGIPFFIEETTDFGIDIVKNPEAPELPRLLEINDET